MLLFLPISSVRSPSVQVAIRATTLPAAIAALDTVYVVALTDSAISRLNLTKVLLSIVVRYSV